MREPMTDWNKEWVACAEEAAGKARSELLPAWFSQFLTNVCELPDRNSPDDEPEAVVATLEELRNCAISAIEQCAAPTPTVAADAAAPTPLGSPAEGHWGEPETPSDGHRLESDVDEEAQPYERAAFEAWARVEFDLRADGLTRNGESYKYTAICDAWAAWQARATAPQATQEANNA